MAVELFKLVGSVFIDTDKANDSLQKTDKKASNFASTLGNVAGTALKFGTAAVGVATAVGGAALGVAEKVSKQTNEIDKASIRMGISAESYQELAYAAGQCGVEMSTMEQAAKKLEGTDLSLDDALNQIMQLGTEEERSAAAAELFGDKIAYTLSPLLQQSGEDFEGLIQRANDLGLVMSDDAVKNGVEFGDMLSDIKQMAGSLATQIGTALFPRVNALFEQIIAFMPQIQGYVPQLVPFLVQIVSAILPVLFSIVEALMPVLMEIISEIMPLAVQIIESLLPLITALLPLIEPISSLLMTILVPLVDLLATILPGLITFLTNLVDALMPALIFIIEEVETVVGETIASILRNLKPFFEQFLSIFNGITKFLSGVFTGNWQQAWEGIKDIAKGIINTILSYVQATINSWIDMINAIINGAKKIANIIPGVDLDVSGATIPQVNIPLLAKGGVIEESGQAIVGEAGAELLTLPQGAKVEPLKETSTLTKEDITSAFIEALQTVGLQVTINPNTKNLFDEIVSQNTVYKRTHGGLSAL